LTRIANKSSLPGLTNVVRIVSPALTPKDIQVSKALLARHIPKGAA
jgi:hypothetical protein